METWIAVAPCWSCKQPAKFNPKYVPCKDGAPICKDCMTLVNTMRVKLGRDPLPIHPQAYEPFVEKKVS